MNKAAPLKTTAKQTSHNITTNGIESLIAGFLVTEHVNLNADFTGHLTPAFAAGLERSGKPVRQHVLVRADLCHCKPPCIQGAWLFGRELKLCVKHLQAPTLNSSLALYKTQTIKTRTQPH